MLHCSLYFAKHNYNNLKDIINCVKLHTLQAGVANVPAGSGPPSPTGSEGVREGDVGSENATGVGTATGEEQMLEQLSDVSDTGWDTDLEIEGDNKGRKICVSSPLHSCQRF